MRSKAFLPFMCIYVCVFGVAGIEHKSITITFPCEKDTPSIAWVSTLKFWVLIKGLNLSHVSQGEWFSHFSHHKHPGGLAKMQIASLTPRVSDSVGVGWNPRISITTR